MEVSPQVGLSVWTLRVKISGFDWGRPESSFGKASILCLLSRNYDDDFGQIPYVPYIHVDICFWMCSDLLISSKEAVVVRVSMHCLCVFNRPTDSLWSQQDSSHMGLRALSACLQCTWTQRAVSWMLKLTSAVSHRKNSQRTTTTTTTTTAAKTCASPVSVQRNCAAAVKTFSCPALLGCDWLLTEDDNV